MRRTGFRKWFPKMGLAFVALQLVATLTQLGRGVALDRAILGGAVAGEAGAGAECRHGIKKGPV